MEEFVSLHSSFFFFSFFFFSKTRPSIALFFDSVVKAGDFFFSIEKKTTDEGEYRLGENNAQVIVKLK